FQSSSNRKSNQEPALEKHQKIGVVTPSRPMAMILSVSEASSERNQRLGHPPPRGFEPAPALSVFPDTKHSLRTSNSCCACGDTRRYGCIQQNLRDGPP